MAGNVTGGCDIGGMRQTPDQPDHGGPDRPAADASPLLGIDAAAADLHADFARLLRLTVDALDWGGTGRTAGCTVHDYLVFEAGLPGWLAGQLESVARRLSAVPQVAELFWAGVLTFDQIAGFVRATSACNGELLARLDEECASRAGALAEAGRLRGWSHDVELLVEDLKAPGWREREEQRLAGGQKLVAQQDFDGGGFIGEWLDPVGFATRMAAVDAEADPDADGIQRARAEASVRIAEHYLAAGGDAAPAALSARMTGLLAQHADLVVQVRDGARPVLELVARNTDDIPAQIRRMVQRRDRGCRFPDCRAPRRLLHVHHIVHVADGGTHDPDNLILLCSFHHLRYVHRLGWTAELDGATGRVSWTSTRTGTTMSTMPHGTRPPPRRDPTLLPDWLAPPRPPPPDHLEPPRDLHAPP